MAYLPNIPQATDYQDASQPQLLENFTQLNNIFAIDHATFNAASNNGKHNKVTFPTQAVAPSFSAGEMGLFNQTAAPTAQPDVWMARGTATPFPITGFANGTISGNNATAWSYLPSGFLVIGGQNTTASGSVTITFNSTAGGGLTGFPGFTSFVCFIQAIRIDNSGSSTTVMRVKSFSLTQAVFGLANGSSDSTFFWVACGL
jgi:hypothetical protein